MDLIQIAWRKRFDDKICLCYEPAKDFLASGRFQAKGDSSLVVIETEPVKALLRMNVVFIKGPDVSSRVSPWPLNFYDVRPEITQDLAAEKPQFVG